MTMEWETGIADPLRLNDEGHQQELNGISEWPKDISNYLFGRPWTWDIMYVQNAILTS